MPFLEYDAGALPDDSHRGGHPRAYASAEHPIAFGAAMAVLLPLAFYKARATGQRRWWLAAGAMLFGVLSAQSRTGIIMLVTITVGYVIFYPRETKRLWPLVIPALAVIHVFLPGSLGATKDSFFPKGGLVAQQAQPQAGSGRIATLGPVLRDEFLPNPIFGEGYATRITVSRPGQVRNALITDDEWLALLAQAGAFGVLAFMWVFIRAIRRMGRAAKGDRTARGALLVATTVSIAAFGVGMFTVDAFSFTQVTLLFFIVLALGAATLLTSSEEWEQPARSAASA
jgi:hypothetical protein